MILQPIRISYDNQGALKPIKTGIFKAKAKHIDVKYHHTHNEQKNHKPSNFTSHGGPRPRPRPYVNTEPNLADLTKPLTRITLPYKKFVCFLAWRNPIKKNRENFVRTTIATNTTTTLKCLACVLSKGRLPIPSLHPLPSRQMHHPLALLYRVCKSWKAHLTVRRSCKSREWL